SKNNQVWIIHGFNGSPKLAKQLLDLGFHISFGSQLKNQNSKASKAISGIAPHRLFLETDTAELSIQEIYCLALRQLEISMEQLKRQIWINFETQFL
ncbi:MAG: TatD family hydrolase, partial [Bacteroidales bacterium]|nr:TatD family hydrolase [Bacteroidales bacterium]